MAFYVNNRNEQEGGQPRLVINYKPLNKALRWIRYPSPQKSMFISRISGSKIFFDQQSGFWQIQIDEKDRYKTACSYGQYEWNVMPFGLKNAPAEFKKVMDTIIRPIDSFTIAYIYDVLVFSPNLDSHFKHVEAFRKAIEHYGMALSSARKMKLFQEEVTFLGHKIKNGQIQVEDHSIEFAKKFPDRILDRKQLQPFLGCFNYLSYYY